ncbi:hypothetical protein ACWD25_58825, partial [Streptomyces sp. NPDC002920]
MVEVAFGAPVAVAERVVPSVFGSRAQHVQHVPGVAIEGRAAGVDDLRVGPGPHGRHQCVLLEQRVREGLVDDDQVAGEAAATAFGPGDELDPGFGVEPLEALFAVGVRDLDADAVDLVQVLVVPDLLAELLDQLPDAPERFHGGLVLVRRPEDDFLAQHQEAEQDSDFEDAALSVLAGDQLGVLEAGPLAVVPAGEQQVDRVPLPGVGDQAGALGPVAGRGSHRVGGGGGVGGGACRGRVGGEYGL